MPIRVKTGNSAIKANALQWDDSCEQLWGRSNTRMRKYEDGRVCNLHQWHTCAWVQGWVGVRLSDDTLAHGNVGGNVDAWLTTQLCVIIRVEGAFQLPTHCRKTWVCAAGLCGWDRGGFSDHNLKASDPNHNDRLVIFRVCHLSHSAMLSWQKSGRGSHMVGAWGE